MNTKHKKVDWEKVPVIITGEPNPEALRMIAESIDEFEIGKIASNLKTDASSEAESSSRLVLDRKKKFK